MNQRGRHRATLANVGLALVAIAATLLAAELAARSFFPAPRYHDAPLELDAEFGFRGVAGYRELARDAEGEFAFELNASGWRGADASSSSRTPGRVRLAFFGDSFLVGRGLRSEALLPNRTIAGLATRGVDAEAFNFSAIDYGTAQELLVFRRVVSELRPEAVVLAFYIGNDVVNNEPALAGRTAVSAGDYVRPYLDGPEFRDARFLHPLRASLRSASRLFATLERRALLLASRPRFAWLRPFPPAEAQGVRQRARRAPREGLEVLRPHADGSEWELGWQRTLGLLSAFRREAEAAGARFLVLVIPLEEQVQRSAKTVAFDWASRRMAGVPLDDVLDWNLPDRRLAEYFSESGIEARQLTGVLREHAGRGVTPYTRDRHLNALGHETAAAEVVAWWLEEASDAPQFDGRPELWVPEAQDAPTTLDFRSSDHARFLGDGWIEWRAEAPGVPGGWRVGPRSLAVLPDPGGTAVVRGHAGADANFPFSLALEVAGQRTKVIHVAGPGPFEVRLPRVERAERSGNGYAVVLVGQHGSLDADVRIQELLIDAASGSRGGRASGH